MDDVSKPSDDVEAPLITKVSMSLKETALNKQKSRALSYLTEKGDVIEVSEETPEN